MAVLGEQEGKVRGLEVGAEFEDVGEGGGGHVEEDVLHVDDEEDCGHGFQNRQVDRELDDREVRKKGGLEGGSKRKSRRVEECQENYRRISAPHGKSSTSR